MFLRSCGLLHLDPTWINDLLREILDHRLQGADNEEYWESELRLFEEQHPDAGMLALQRVHLNFCTTGTLTVDYLRFLWRNVRGAGDNTVLKCLINTMSEFGVVFKSTSSPDTMYGAHDVPGGGDHLLVPVRLPPFVTEEDLEEFSIPSLQHGYRRQAIYRIAQSYVPPGLIGLLMARFLKYGVQFHTCWRDGASFIMGGPEVLIFLNPVNAHRAKAEIEVNVTGAPMSKDVEDVMRDLMNAIENVLADHFPGLFVSPRARDPRSIRGDDALLDKIVHLESHLDARLGLVDRGLEDVGSSSRESLARLGKLQAKDYPFPQLVIVREATVVSSQGERRRRMLSKQMFRELGRLVSGCGKKKMRLYFLCPFDYSEVPCGIDGDGYPFSENRAWLKKLFPVLQVRKQNMEQIQCHGLWPFERPATWNRVHASISIAGYNIVCD